MKSLLTTFIVFFVILASRGVQATNDWVQKATGASPAGLEDSSIKDIGTNVGIGVTDFTDYYLDVDGTFRCEGIRVDKFGGSDYPPNIVMGHSSNDVCTWDSNCEGNTIGGGGESGYRNLVCTGISYATISGGKDNQVCGTSLYGTVGGGYSNYVTAFSSTVAGGYDNYSGGNYTSVGGGYQNAALSGFGATVPGGAYNWATGAYSLALVLVGSSNTLSPDTLTISEFQYGMLPQAFVFIKATDHRSWSFLH